MAKYNQNKVPYQRQDDLLDDFCTAITKLKSKNEIKDFFKDILNRQERLMIIRRLQIAEMLASGSTYAEIRKALGASEITIARVSRWLNFGRDGYKNILRKKKQR